MTKRNCYVTDVGDAIEKLADALDPERKPPFSGDILDLLEWATKDVLAVQQQFDAANTLINKYREETTSVCRHLAAARVEVAELRQQVALLRDAVKNFLSDNDPEGFGCACSPNFICGPCSEARRQQPLYEALAITEPKP